MSTLPGPLLKPSIGGPVDVLWLAGEHSGDQHAARVATHLKEAHPEMRQVAIGGPALARRGFPLLFDLTESSVVGLVEVLMHYGFFKRLFAEVISWIRTHRPKVVVFVDYPGFNLRLAEALFNEGLSRKAGGPVSIYYYISPQVWAWKGKRRFKMARLVDELGVIFPFEVETFADTELDTHFVGHPFLDPAFASTVQFDAEGALLLLPGSRIQPVKRIFPAMLEAVDLWRHRRPENRQVPLTTIAPNASVEEVLKAMLADRHWPIYIQRAGQIAEARMVLTSSGTMSLECALSGAPGAIVYRAHPVTCFLARRMVKVPYLGIANLILGRPMYPEFIQGEAEAERLADELEACLMPERIARTRADEAALRAKLAAPTSATAADRIASLLSA